MSREGCNAPEFLFTAAGFVRGRQPQPCCKLAAIAELMAITNAGDDRRGCHNTNVPLPSRACLHARERE